MVTCKICNESFRAISNSHLSRHGTNQSDYSAKYGTPMFCSGTSEKRSNTLKELHGHSDAEWSDLPLGLVPDSVIAEMKKCSISAVGRRRRMLGIQAFVGFIMTQEGLPTRSMYEAMYDAYLHWKQIEHAHEVAVPGTKYIADFKIGDSYVEVFGMLGYSKYKTKSEEKLQAYRLLEVRFRIMEPHEIEFLYEECPVRVNFRRRSCLMCGAVSHDLVKGLCRGTCYMQSWRSANALDATCEACGGAFTRDASSVQKYCSRKCYWNAVDCRWPSWGWLDEQTKTRSIASIARELGVRAGSLHQRIYRRSQPAKS